MNTNSRLSLSLILILTCILAVAVIVMSAAACASKQRASSARVTDDFQCRDRRIAYIVADSFAGPEVGVVADCAERGPRIKKWIVMDDQGTRKDGEHSLDTAQFDALWDKIESTGWRNLSNCDNPDAQEGDPAYKFGIKDHELTVSLECAGKVLPFPYDRMANELDLLSAEFGL